MNKDRKYKNYNSKFDYSYSFGTYATIDMIKYKPEIVDAVLVHEALDECNLELLRSLCEKHNIPIKQNCNKVIERIRNKESCNVIGIFEKCEGELDESSNHVVLVNPSDMGNMGTILRTCLGFGVFNIAIIKPGVDIFNPKVVRASMGAIFQLNVKYYNSFNEYKEQFGHYDFYPFMLDAAIDLKLLNRNNQNKYALIFGNESSGLDNSFLNEGQSVFIKHNDKIDSLNLGIAVGIALFEFGNKS